MTCFTDKEEAAVNLVDQMPFLLETRLKELGANFTSADNFQCHVVVNIKFLITRAQNQGSGGENSYKETRAYALVSLHRIFHLPRIINPIFQIE